MTEPIPRVGQMVQLLASPWRVQQEILIRAPQSPADHEPGGHNDILSLIALYDISWGPVDGNEGAESRSSWLERTQMTEDFIERAMSPAPEALRHLGTAIRMIEGLGRPFLYTRHGLRSAHEWELVRRLATEVCEELGWHQTARIDSFSDFCVSLGGEQLDTA